MVIARLSRYDPTLAKAENRKAKEPKNWKTNIYLQYFIRIVNF